MHTFSIVTTNVTISQDAEITADGNVIGNGEMSVEDIEGDAYIMCDTCNERVFAGETHGGITLAEDWQVQ